ncbi:PQQ enzyme repeat protein [Ostertagia ostertagi]
MWVDQLWLTCVLLMKLTDALFEDQVGSLTGASNTSAAQCKFTSMNGVRTSDCSSLHERAYSLHFRLTLDTYMETYRKKHSIWVTSSISPADETTLYTVSNAGRVVRAWSKRNGALLWQRSIAEKADLRTSPIIALASNTVVISSSDEIFAFSETGEIRWSARVEKSSWSRISVDNDIVHHLSIMNGVFHVRDFSLSTGESLGVKAKSIKVVAEEKCITMRNFFLCADDESLYVVNGISSTLNDESKPIGFKIKELTVLDNDHLLVKGLVSASVLRLSPDGLQEVLSLKHGVDSAAMYSDTLVTISGKNVEVHDMKTLKRIFEAALPLGEENFAPVESVYMSIKEAIELLIVRRDCRMEFVIIDIPKSSVVCEWVREEALARISSVEMVDLPLSELQQMIEDEFEEGGTSGIMSSFVRRLISQTSQIHKWLLKTINEVFTFSYMLSTRTNSFSKLLQHVRSAAKSGNHSGEALERDFFNLRKIIVATTLNGVAFGLDSSDGSIVWRLWLGNHFAPLSSFTGKSEVPLFVQRSTAHYQLPGQASVAFKDSVSSAGMLIFFNPITGKVVKETKLPMPIKRVDVLNFVGQEHIYPLVVIGTNDEQQRKIIAIKGKPRHQKMHSQGRVLIDRNVAYKYANPNLVAIATLDSVHQYLSIFLVDVVSGQMIHSARLAKATAPVHVVHCEHWIADRFDSLIPTKKAPEVVTQSFIYAQGIQAMAVSETEKGLTTRSLLMALPLGGIHEVTRKLLDATRPLELTQEMREEMMIPYIPEIPIATEDMVNYNQTVYRVQGIKTS